MTHRSWQRLAVTALGIIVVFGFVPVWPDGVRVAALVVGALTGVVSGVLWWRLRRVERERAGEWGGANDAAQHGHAWRDPDVGARFDDRRSGGYAGSE